MNKIDNLVEILKRMNNGEAPDDIKKETQELLEQIDATELSLAEQKLIEEGMKPEDLRGLCSIHMDMLKDELDKLRAAVGPGHPLDTLVKEHEEILGFLDQLDRLNTKIQKAVEQTVSSDDLSHFEKLSGLLLAAENHHLREEEALFPALEGHGISGPPRIMRLEHNELRARKKRLLQLVKNYEYLSPELFKGELDELAKYIVFNLRDHIFKENHILYPSALENIQEDEEWLEIRSKCDLIGYCPFTPL